jgi:hypothetical protein
VKREEQLEDEEETEALCWTASMIHPVSSQLFLTPHEAIESFGRFIRYIAGYQFDVR